MLTLPGRRIAGWGLGVLIALLGACTQIPRAELAAYQKAFAEARSAGEQIALDYRNVLDRNAAVDAAKHPTPPPDPVDVYNKQFEYDEQAALGAGTKPLDAVDARLAAWAALDKYNQALAAVAEGRSSEEIGSMVDGLLKTLQGFPVDDIAGAIADVVPYAGVAKVALEILQREQEARRFREAVLKAGPEIRKFAGLLRADCKGFLALAVGVRDAEHAMVTDEFPDQLDRISAMAASYGVDWKQGVASGNADISGIVTELDRRLRAVPEYMKTGLAPFDAAVEDPATPELEVEPVDAEAVVRVQLAADAVEKDLDRLCDLDKRTLAYKHALEAFEALVIQMNSSTAALQAAAEKGKGTLPDPERTRRLAAEARKALEVYKSRR